jgi:hypothetical protein
MTRESSWPRYVGFTLKDILVLFRFIGNPANLRTFLTITTLIAAYVIGLHLPVPLVSHPATSELERWWFLQFLDSLLTGGALQRASIFSMGALAPAVFGASLRQRRMTPPEFLGRVGVLLIVSVLLTFALRSRGLIGQSYRDFQITLIVVALGGVALKLINTQLVRLHGPGILYVNLFLMMAASLRNVVPFMRHGDYRPLVMMAAFLAFIAVSVQFLVRKRVRIGVQNIKIAGRPRSATLEISAMDETLLDSVSTLCLLFYISTASLASLLFGWRSITADNYPVLAGISLAAMAVVGIAFRDAQRRFNFVPFLGSGAVLGVHDAKGYALRMLNNFWIIPGQKAGPDSERFIQAKTVPILRWVSGLICELSFGRDAGSAPTGPAWPRRTFFPLRLPGVCVRVAHVHRLSLQHIEPTECQPE